MFFGRFLISNKFTIGIFFLFLSVLANAQVPFSGKFVRGGSVPLGNAVQGLGDACFNGSVTAIEPVPSLNRVIVGGDFTEVGPCIGSGIPVDPTTGSPVSGFSRRTMAVNGLVQHAISDGAGGWYIAGFFESVGLIGRKYVARILSTGQVDPTFNPDYGVIKSGAVSTLALDGNTLYIGGSFLTNTLSYGTPLDSSGQSTFPVNQLVEGEDAPFDDDVTASVPDGVGGWFVAGDFTKVQGVARSKLARLNADGTLDATFNVPVVGSITTLKIAAGILYLGGTINEVGGQDRFNLAAIDIATQTVTGFAVNPSASVSSIESDGSTVWVGGGFSIVNPNSWNTRMAAIDLTTGLPDNSWPKVYGDINAMISDGAGGWYIGGTFSQVGTFSRSRIARILSDKTVDPNFNPSATSTVNDLALSGSTLYVGGAFLTIGNEARNRIAAVDVTTGLVTAWNPNSNNAVNTIAVSGSVVYVGGAFSNIGGQARSSIAALSATTGLATTWNPSSNSSVLRIVISGTTVYAGGSFTNIGGQPRNRIAALDTGSNVATSWNPNAGSNVTSLVVNGTSIYVGGLFTTIGGASRNRIAEINLSDGLATSWNPDSKIGRAHV